MFITGQLAILYSGCVTIKHTDENLMRFIGWMCTINLFAL